MLRIHGFILLINVAIPSMAFQYIKDCTHGNTTFTLWQPFLTCFAIHPISLHIIIPVFHHGKALLIDNPPKMDLPHHSEALVDMPIYHLMK